MLRKQITNKTWKQLKEALERVRDRRGTASTQSERDFLEAVLWIARTGSPWRDLPPQLGHWHNVYVRFRRWEKAGIWFRLWQEIQHKSFAQAQALSIDTTTVRASSACQWGSKKNASAEALERSRGGLTTKIHAACIDPYTSVSFHLSEGQRFDFCGFEHVYQQIDANNVLESAALDKGYDSDAIRDKLAYDGIEPVIPPKQSRCLKPQFNKDLYKQRNRIERFFNKLKNYRRVATRYDKYAASFFAFVLMASSCISLKLFVNTA